MPLHRAVRASKLAAVEFLIERSLDPAVRIAEGKTCIEIAEEQEDWLLQKRLMELMTKGGAPFEGKKNDDLELGNELHSKHGNLGRKDMLKSMFKGTAAHKLFPLFWVTCISIVLFEYLVDLRVTGWQVAPTASLVFEVGIPLSLVMFMWVALTDPGKVPPRAKGSSGVEELMHSIDSDCPDDQLPDVSRLCTTSWVLKDLRTKFCAQTGACIEEFDHYCIWLNTAIGKRNHRQFICLAMVECLTQICNVYLCWSVMRALVPYQNCLNWVVCVVINYPLLVLLVILHFVTTPWVFLLTFQHLRMVSANMTTNEMMNIHRYNHFWVTNSGPQKQFRNPFNKGGSFQNQLDFWWQRTRSQIKDKPRSCNAACKGCHAVQ